MKRPSDTEEPTGEDVTGNLESADTPRKCRRISSAGHGVEGKLPDDDRAVSDDESSKPASSAQEASNNSATLDKGSEDIQNESGKAKAKTEDGMLATDLVEGGGETAGKKWLEFPAKLMDLLQRGVAPDAIWFLPEGKAIGINKEKFIEKILNQHFRGNKFTSAIRMFNRWGFRRISHPTLKDKEIGFHNLLFRRDAPELVEKMKKDSDASEVIRQLEMAGDMAAETQSHVTMGSTNRASSSGNTAANVGQLRQQQQDLMAQQSFLFSQMQQQQPAINPFPYQGQPGGFNLDFNNMQQNNPMWGSSFAQQQFQFLQQQQQQPYAQFPSNFAVNNPTLGQQQQQQMQSHPESAWGNFGMPTGGMFPNNMHMSFPASQQHSFDAQVTEANRGKKSGETNGSTPFQGPQSEEPK